MSDIVVETSEEDMKKKESCPGVYSSGLCRIMNDTHS